MRRLDQSARYTALVRSAVAEALRDETRRQVLALSPAERVALAHRLGDEDASRYASFHGVLLDEARRRLRAARRAGRRASCVALLD